MLSSAISLLQLVFSVFSSRLCIRKKTTTVLQLFCSVVYDTESMHDQLDQLLRWVWLIDWLIDDVRWSAEVFGPVEMDSGAVSSVVLYVWAGVNTTIKVGCRLNQLDQEDLENVVHLQTNFVQSVCSINTIQWNQARGKVHKRIKRFEPNGL